MSNDKSSNLGYWTAGVGVIALATYLIMATPGTTPNPVASSLAAAALLFFFLVDIVDQAIQSTCRWPS